MSIQLKLSEGQRKLMRSSASGEQISSALRADLPEKVTLGIVWKYEPEVVS